jgi:hypothetical protein
MPKFRSWYLVWFSLAGIAALSWLYQSWVISGYLAEDRRQLPSDFKFDLLVRLLDPRIQAAENLQHWAFIAAIVFAIAGLVSLAPRLACVFLVRLSDGVATVVKGRVPPGFLDDLTDCCRDAKVLAGEVWGQFTPRGIRLNFSANFSPGVRQRLRNIWVQYTLGPRPRPR